MRITPFMRELALFSLVALTLATYGCSTSSKLVHDSPNASGEPTTHCGGTQSLDDSKVAVVPIPGVAFLSPRADTHDIKPDDYLSRCGQPTQLVNRDVEVSRGICILTAPVTELVTLGIWQWCPAHVEWSADVIAQSAPLPPVAPMSEL